MFFDMCITAMVLYVTVVRGWGDPHLVTIDGRRFTFNGLGEYLLITTNVSDFEFQGRTTLAANSNATMFSDFALREGDEYVEVCNCIMN